MAKREFKATKPRRFEVGEAVLYFSSNEQDYVQATVARLYGSYEVGTEGSSAIRREDGYGVKFGVNECFAPERRVSPAFIREEIAQRHDEANGGAA
ncbi:MAG: hypothetical protein IPJ25_14855 [Rhodocyclaceae bacterium]|nr:hypothetical protein [Rhodocyclaceae bacterium]